ncbi:hypothetical protein [Rhodococcus sp. 4CII]|uniref:hypothetical protein n=1 Tax=Rhodococcus sp. 4CII TaxID=2834580 RepID=UPI00163DC47B|nr:hypothetical protein [Rhodococcus sp. 4CII]
MVRSQDTTDEIERAIARISEQMNSNNHRTGLTTAQNAAGIAEMLDLGVPVERVSKELSVKRKAVKLLGAVGRREAARASLEEQGLTIEQAAIVAKFFLMWTSHGEPQPGSDQLVVGWCHARADREDRRNRVLGGPGRVRW